MCQRWAISLSALLVSLPAAAQPPAPNERQRVLEAAREAALHYSDTLPDFICTETVRRVPTVAMRPIGTDTLTIQVSFSGKKEDHKLVAIDGSRTDKPLDSLGGLITGGEFGSWLQRIFDPSSSAEFEWKGWSEVGKQRVPTFTYKVARAHSQYVVGYRADNGKFVSGTAGFAGEVWLDGPTSRVLRLTVKATEIPADAAILMSTTEVDYNPVDVAGSSYLLPTRAEAHLRRSNIDESNVVTFAGYRKFAAESTLDFGLPKDK
jgi:hypothetical protein